MQVPHVMLLDQVGMIPEHGERRRGHIYLGRVHQPDLPSGRLWRLPARDELAQPLVDLGGRYALRPLGGHFEDDVEHPVDPEPRFR